MSALADFRAQIRLALMDAAAGIWDDDSLDQALRQALEHYAIHLPLEAVTAFELPGAGREIDLSAISGLRCVWQVYWPFDDSRETWPPNRARGFSLYFDDGSPVLFLNQVDGSQPQAGEVVKIWYAAQHSIQDLDGASATTPPAGHQQLLVDGAAGLAAMARSLDLVETAGADLYGAGLLGTWASRKLKVFYEKVRELAAGRSRGGQAFGYGEGWKLDRWDV